VIKIAVIPVTQFQQNCTLMWCEETMRGAVSDPGGDLDQVEAAARQFGVNIEKVFLTHGHADHCGAAGTLAKQLGVPLEGPHEDDLFLIEGLVEQGSRFGFTDLSDFRPDRWLHQGDTVSFGKQTLEVYHCPGHTPGHVVFFHREANLAIVGDVLFAGSIGRTDFPRGNHDDLIHSIRDNLFPLGDEVVFVPGHGPNSSFGRERTSNPYVSDRALGIVA
jgi:glyoxylase-like metal-dependent hydrolase (beta-lactamase superfamily II)